MTVHINGTPASIDDLARFAFSGFAHFTAMQVRGGAVRGLDLHLLRLRQASQELFGSPTSDETVLGHVATALNSHFADFPHAHRTKGSPTGSTAQIHNAKAASLMCFVTPSTREFSGPSSTGTAADLDIVVKVMPPHTVTTKEISLDVVEHERHLPGIKHVGEVAKTQYLRQARRRGFDDAAFVDRAGNLSEATIWNLAFFDGTTVIWPEAAMLPGVTMQILQRQLRRQGIAQERRPMTIETVHSTAASAVVMNSWTPGIPVTTLATVELPNGAGSGEFIKLLHAAYAAEAPVSVL